MSYTDPDVWNHSGVCKGCAYEPKDSDVKCKKGIEKGKVTGSCPLFLDKSKISEAFNQAVEEYGKKKDHELINEFARTMHGCHLGPQSCFVCARQDALLAVLKDRLKKFERMLEEAAEQHRKIDTIACDINDSINKTAAAGQMAHVGFLSTRMESLMKQLEFFEKHIEEWKKW